MSLLYYVHLWMKYSFDVSNSLEEISSLSPSVVFLHFFSIIRKKAFLSLLSILWNCLRLIRIIYRLL